MKRFASLLLAAACTVGSWAFDFNEVFADSTLRLDYVLTGMPGDVDISLMGMQKAPGWYGRRVNLDKLFLDGNGDLTVTTMAGDTVYRNSFSSLFNEWLDIQPDAQEATECTLLMPMPKVPVMVNVHLYDKRRNPMACIHHKADPADILISQSSPARKPLPHSYIRMGDYPGHRINVVFLAEGYTPDEMDVFRADAAEAVDALLSHEPFGEMRERFDFIAVESPSVDSGVSIPRFNDWKDTAFGSHFSTFYSDRYLTSPRVFRMYDALWGIPAEHIIVLVNTEEYGGGGIFNDYTLTAAHHPMFRPVVVHEFGHSFGGLADEYQTDGDVMDDTYPADVEPWEPNITTLVDFDSKWRSMLAPDTPVPTDWDDAEQYPVGVYEGAAYSARGRFRPAFTCRMRDNDIPHFCPVCQEALKNIILFYTEE